MYSTLDSGNLVDRDAAQRAVHLLAPGANLELMPLVELVRRQEVVQRAHRRIVVKVTACHG